jgi:hypothetical protein
LPEATGLSPQNVAFALDHSLEVNATDDELRRLVAYVPRSETAHVLLSANLLTAPLRAVALAIASAPQRFVRPSRREPLFTTLMKQAAPEAFELTEWLTPAPFDHVWAYGSDETMHTLVRSWQPGVTLHAHGHGYGVIALDAPDRLSASDFDAMALDVAAFDQRGCLSPRVVVVRSDAQGAHFVAKQLFLALERINLTIPLGRLSDAELAERARHRDLWRYLGTCHESPVGLVSVDVEGGPWTEAPNGRVIHVRQTTDNTRDLREHEPEITTVSGQLDALEMLATLLPHARIARFGWMQRPPLDGPVDRRGDPKGLVLGNAPSRHTD